MWSAIRSRAEGVMKERRGLNLWVEGWGEGGN